MLASTREQLRQAIQAVGKSPRSEDEITSLALKLSSQYQQSGLTIDVIIDEVTAASGGQFDMTPSVGGSLWRSHVRGI